MYCDFRRRQQDICPPTVSFQRDSTECNAKTALNRVGEARDKNAPGHKKDGGQISIKSTSPRARHNDGHRSADSEAAAF